MSRKIEIKSDTNYKTEDVPVGNARIRVLPANINPNTIYSQLNNTGETQYTNNKEVIAGELAMVQRNTAEDIGFLIEQKRGELFVQAEDAHNYSINDKGELIYTFR